MHTRTRFLFAALTAAFALAAAVGTAGARRIELTNQLFRAVWRSSKLTFEDHGGNFAACPVTLEGSFHSQTLSKVCGQLVGYVTKAALTGGECTFGGVVTGVTILQNTLPWHILYISFTGTLPNIERIRLSLRNAGFQLNAHLIVNILCLYLTSSTNPAFGEVIATPETGQVNELKADETIAIPKNSGGEACPASGFFAGTAAVTQLASSTKITIRLVE